MTFLHCFLESWALGVLKNQKQGLSYFLAVRGIVLKAIPSVSNQSTRGKLWGRGTAALVLFLVCVPRSLLRRPSGQRALGHFHWEQGCLSFSVMGWLLTALH